MNFVNGFVFFVHLNFRSGTFKKNAVGTNSRKLYKNGALIAVDSPSISLSVNSMLTIGTLYGSAFGGNTAFQYYGAVDEFRFHMSELSSTDVYNLFNSNSNAIPVEMYIPFSSAAVVRPEVAKAFIYDLSSNAHHLYTITSNVPVYESDKTLCLYKPQATTCVTPKTDNGKQMH
jgi:hypothetical protein